MPHSEIRRDFSGAAAPLGRTKVNSPTEAPECSHRAARDWVKRERLKVRHRNRGNVPRAKVKLATSDVWRVQAEKLSEHRRVTQRYERGKYIALAQLFSACFASIGVLRKIDNDT